MYYHAGEIPGPGNPGKIPGTGLGISLGIPLNLKLEIN
jgi:hypothetical protein